MFDKLQKVDWSKKRLAQDSAVEVPSKILALTSLDHVERRAAYSWLKAQLLLDGRYLQVNGDINEALLDSLDNDPLPEPELVVMLAVGSPCHLARHVHERSVARRVGSPTHSTHLHLRC